MGSRPVTPFEMQGPVAIARFAGRFDLQEIAQAVTDAITDAVALGHRKLLLDTLATSGYDVPSLAERYFIAVQWADATNKVVQMALVLQPPYVDPERFGVLVAHNRGAHANVFTTLPTALHWLNPT